MNKKEVRELRKHFTVNDDLYTLKNGLVVYVSSEGEVVCTKQFSFVSVSDSELELYYKVLKQVLSAKVCKNLLEYEFKKDGSGKTPGFDRMYELLQSELKDLEIVEKMISDIDYVGPYVLILANCRYTMFRKDRDDVDNKYNAEDYHHIIGAICPMSVTESSVVYDISDQQLVRTSPRLTMSNLPSDGFIYPAFNDRAADVNRVMYYMRNCKTPNVEFVDAVLGCEFGMTYHEERAAYKLILESVLGDELSYSVISEMNSRMRDLVTSYRNETNMPIVDKQYIMAALNDIGVSGDVISRLDVVYDGVCGDSSLYAVNLVDNNIVVSSGTASAKVSCADQVDVFVQSNGEIRLSTRESVVDINGMSVSV